MNCGRITLTSDSEASDQEVIEIPVERELMKGSTPTLVLSVLARTSAHGYQMAKELERLSKGVLTLKEGTLYPILHGLEQEGLITATWERGDGRERKVYSLTDSGKAELQLRVARWQEFRTAVDDVVQGGVPSFANP